MKQDPGSVSEFYEQFHAERGKVGTVGFPERIRFIRECVGTGREVIELGCRFGGLMEHFVTGNNVTGVDVDRVALRACSERLGVSTQVVNLNERLPYSDASFDVAVISEVLEHLPYPEVTLAEAARILRPGGKLVGSVPNGTRLKQRLRFLFTGVVDTDRTHLHHFSSSQLTQLFERWFADVEVVPVAGRFTFLSKKMFGKCLLFQARKVGQ